MARIKITDLPNDQEISKDDMAKVMGGRLNQYASVTPVDQNISFRPPSVSSVTPSTSNAANSAAILSNPIAGLSGTFVSEPDPKMPASLCFSPKTPVMTSEGIRPINSIKEGDRVLTYDLKSNRIVETRVLNVDIHLGDFELLDVEIDGSEIIYATSNHKFHDGNGWVRCDELSKILLSTGAVCKVDVLNNFRKENFVYNLRTEKGTYLVGHMCALVSGGTILDILDLKVNEDDFAVENCDRSRILVHSN